MFPSFVLGVVLATLAQPSAGQSSMVSSNYYRLITIDAGSWTDIATCIMANTGLFNFYMSLNLPNESYFNFITDQQGFSVQLHAHLTQIARHTITNH